jgi:hypothetical protein
MSTVRRVAVGVALACLAAPEALAQSRAAAASPGAAPGAAYVLPRTPWGDPDLQGIWPGTRMMGVPIERPPQLGERATLSDAEFAARETQARTQAAADREELVAPRPAAGRGAGAGTGPPGHWGERGAPQRQTSLVSDPPNGRIPPMTAEGQRRTAAVPRTWYYDNDGGGPFNAPTDLSAYDRCITRGVVGSMLPVGYNAGNEIVQSPGYVALRNEMIHETRIVPLDGRPHVPAQIRGYMGDSRGRWDGDTLVVETTNVTDLTGVGANGRAIFHSASLRVMERFTRVAADTIRYELTIDDPVMWTRPWTMAFPLTLESDYGMFEYACHEGNYGLRNILSGSRADERAAQAGSKP